MAIHYNICDLAIEAPDSSLTLPSKLSGSPAGFTLSCIPTSLPPWSLLPHGFYVLFVIGQEAELGNPDSSLSLAPFSLLRLTHPYPFLFRL